MDCHYRFAIAIALAATLGVQMSAADDNDNDRSRACRELPGHAKLREALKSARIADNGGFDLDMWATVVNRDGVVCAVAFTGSPPQPRPIP